MKGTMGDTQRSQTISTKLHEIAEQARDHPERIFTSLAHLIDVDFLRAAYSRTRKDGAPGVDGVTGIEYGHNLEANLPDLYARMRSQRYKATPVKRGWATKEDGSQRPLGMPIMEDKIAQRAVSMLMSAIYEQDFYDFSYGFIEGRSPHQAIKALREQCYKNNIHWLIDADITKFFDNLDHGLLRDIIRKRVNDGGLLRLIGKWLNAGVLEGETLSYPEQGTPQGGVISPLLANIFLHYVLDDWYVNEIKPRLKGRSFLIRFADDFIIGCELEEDARRVMAVLPKRFGRYKLTIHLKKTVLVDFRSPDRRKKTQSSHHTFDFLGFTHYWAKSRKGNWVIKRKTSAKRMRRTMKAIWQWCKENRHWSLPEQHRIISSKLRGHYQYYGIRGNYRMLELVYQCARKSWKRWLGRRSRDGYISWEEFEKKILRVFSLPPPKIVHLI
jgi:group II intron reverse transcriptase/maturase